MNTDRPSRVHRLTAKVYGMLGADGARESGLTALMYATIANFAVDAVLAVSLAGTLFFSATTGESKGSVAAYLLVTIAPFAVLAPVIGPLLDRIRTGRRIAMSLTFAARVILTAVLLQNFDSWLLYPAALGMLVLSKSYGVLKSSVTPRLAPENLDLVRANARLMITGHIGGSMVVGAAAAAVAFVFSPKEALWLLLVCALVGIYLCGLIPSTAESSGDEVFADPFAPTEDLGPAMGAPDGEEAPTVVAPIASSASSSLIGRWRRSMSVRFPDATRTAMWGTAMQRLGTGFMTIYVAFVAKSSHTLSGAEQLALLGVVGAAGGVGTFLGNAVGSRVKFSRPRFTVIMLAVVSLASVVVAAVVDGVPTAAVATLLLSLGSAISKSCLDATIQSGLNPSAQASAFGLSETTLQLSWVLGGTLGLLLPTELTVGMAVLAATGTVFFVNVILASRGLGVGSLIGRARSRS
ncbi:MFS transporter [Corynebacterium variabile]|uniref:MFS transporter n=2 Tax=Corynebacterium variabile TaxID=1727 RepID=UPI0026495A21|nr:MFS transporter [Corynebacterium variabile]MDN6241855.1 MFS transporter [Corynebacterium variabile]MDN6478912.1 MFS transporter [Corynebacterium variabile]MDN6676419.1 MFS transporter [Corynebacterium variabile]MDN6845398.1 MFS transporter [Corynebacterium variabile]